MIGILLTKKCDYGFRVIRALASDDKRLVKDMCIEEQIPEQYTYKILKKLEHAGLVQSFRGRDGGYQLAKPLSTFTIYDVVSAIEEHPFIVECLRDDVSCPLTSSENPCAVHLEFERLQRMLVDEMKNKYMSDIIKKESKCHDPTV